MAETRRLLFAPQRQEEVARRTWRVFRRLALAACIALFPLLFIIDERVETGLSPVLPGMAVLLVLWLAAPFVAIEAWARWGHAEQRRVQRAEHTSKYILGAACAWFLFWLVIG